MHKLYQALLKRYMNEADDGTEGGAGGSTSTTEPSKEELRGDFYDPNKTTEAAPEVKTEPAKAEEPKAEEPKTDEAAAPTIPKARFDEAVNKEREKSAELQRQLEALQNNKVSQQAAANIQTLQDTVAAKREAYENALFDGDREAATRVRAELQAAETAYNTALTSNMSAAAVEEYKAEQAFNSMVSTVESEYPEFNPDSDAFNQELSDKAVELMDAFVAKGESQAVALQKAADLIARANGLEPASKRNAAPAAPAAPAKTPEQIIAEATAAAKGTAVKRNVDAATRQPANLASVGADADLDGMSKGVDVSNMTDKQFAEFRKDEVAFAKARGDLL